MKMAAQSQGVVRTADEGRVVVCIPAFNEEKSIAKVIIKAKEFSDEIIVCNDGSTDMTGEIAGALGATVIRHERNLGKGAALASLLQEASKSKPRVVVSIDGDGQHDPADIPKVIRPVLDGEADLVVGARPMETGIMPKERIIGNKVLDEVTSRKAGMRIKDTQSGFRAYSFQALERLDFTERGMSVESQTLIDAAKAGLRIAEVPVATTYEGIEAKRSPLRQFSGILDYVITRTVADSPLLYLGLPGLIAVVLGVVAGVRVLDIFIQTRQIALGTGLISVTLVIIGSVMLATSVILKFLKSLPRR